MFYLEKVVIYLDLIRFVNNEINFIFINNSKHIVNDKFIYYLALFCYYEVY